MFANKLLRVPYQKVMTKPTLAVVVQYTGRKIDREKERRERESKSVNTQQHSFFLAVVTSSPTIVGSVI